MRPLLAILLLSTAGLGVPCQADTFTQRYAITLDGNAPYYALTVPEQVYAASQRNDLGDVRVFNGAGEPVPYSLEAPVVAVKTAPTLTPVTWFALPAANSKTAEGAPLGVTIAADGSLRASAGSTRPATRNGDIVDLGKPVERISALRVHIANASFQGHVSVAASADLNSWTEFAEADLLKLSAGDNTLLQERIELEGLNGRYLRLRWTGDAPDIKAMELETQGATEAGQALVARTRAMRSGIAAVAGKLAGEYLFDTGGRFPVDRIQLALPQLNTVAHATFYSRPDTQSAWQQVVSAQLYRLRNANGDGEQRNPAIEISPNTDSHWRMVVDMRNGGLGSGMPIFTLGWRPATVTIAARGSGPFSLATGNARLASAALSRADLVVGEPGAIGKAQLGAQLPLWASDKVSDDAPTDVDAKRRYVLWAALVVAVGVLGLMAWRLARSGPSGERR